ncbi:MAG: transposase [Nitrososphaerales archaeon]
MSSALLEIVMGGFLFLVRCRKQDLGTDSTGMTWLPCFDLLCSQDQARYPGIYAQTGGEEELREMTKARAKRFLKLTIGAELRHQIVTSLKIRRGPCDDNRDFKPVCKKAHQVKLLKRGIGDKRYDDEKNHEFLRDELHVHSIIPARNENVPVWRTRGKYRKKMKRGYSKRKYHQRPKDETIFSVIKKVMGDNVRSVRVKAQNNELRFRVIAYNANRIVNLAYFFMIGFLHSPISVEIKYKNA